jgi:hypothetical protein
MRPTYKLATGHVRSLFADTVANRITHIADHDAHDVANHHADYVADDLAYHLVDNVANNKPHNDADDITNHVGDNYTHDDGDDHTDDVPCANRSADGDAYRSADLSWICAWIRRRPSMPCSDYSPRHWM